MLLRNCWCRLLLLLGIFPCGTACAILSNQSTPPSVASSQWTGVGSLSFTSVTDGTDTYVPGSLTGTLIDSTHVLTAAHGVFDRNTGNRFDSSNVTFNVGSQHLQVASIAIPSQFNGRDKSYDLAIVTLTSPAKGVDTYTWNNGLLDPQGKKFTLVGYGQTGSINGVKKSSSFGAKHYATNVVDLVTQGHQSVKIQDQVARHDSKRNKVVLPAGLLAFDFDRIHSDSGPLGTGASSSTEGDGGNGDSGSPMFVLDDNGRPVVIGVLMDGSDSQVRVGEVAWGTNLNNQPYADFITANTLGVSNRLSRVHPNFVVTSAASVPEPGIGLLVAIAAGMLLRRGHRSRV